MKVQSGIWAVAACAGLAVSASVQGQIVNGDFETGDLTGWTEFGETTYNGVWGGEPHGGSFSGYFGPVSSPGGIQQALAGATAGQTYDVSFWLVSELGTTPNSCVCTLDGQTVCNITDFSDPS